jgi:hypothetical protein
MNVGRILVLAFAVAGLCSAAAADEKKADEKKMAMEMPKPGPEMESMKWMVGKWAVVETHEPGPMGPGGKGAGSMTVMLGPGGFSHIMSYESKGPMGSFNGHGVSAWDPNKKKFVGSWTDSMTPGLMTSECAWEGKDMTCTGENMMNGQKASMRTTSKNVAASGWTEVFELSVAGGPYQKMMTLEYKPMK